MAVLSLHYKDQSICDHPFYSFLKSNDKNLLDFCETPKRGLGEY